MARTPKTTIEKYERVARELKGVGHPIRIQILRELVKGEKLSPVDLTERIEPTSLPTVSYHTRELLSAGLIRKAGTKPVRGTLQHFYLLTERGETLYNGHLRRLLAT